MPLINIYKPKYKSNKIYDFMCLCPCYTFQYSRSPNRRLPNDSKVIKNKDLHQYKCFKLDRFGQFIITSFFFLEIRNLFKTSNVLRHLASTPGKFCQPISSVVTSLTHTIKFEVLVEQKMYDFTDNLLSLLQRHILFTDD